MGAMDAGRSGNYSLHARTSASLAAKRADDRRYAANKETPGRSRANFSGGFFAQREAQDAAAADSNVGQGKARAQERSWGDPRGYQGQMNGERYSR